MVGQPIFKFKKGLSIMQILKRYTNKAIERSATITKEVFNDDKVFTVLYTKDRKGSTLISVFEDFAHAVNSARRFCNGEAWKDKNKIEEII